MGRGPAATARPSIAIRVSRETETPLAANGPPTFSERFVTTSRLGSLLASANEKLSDRGAMRLWTAGVLAVGVAIRFGWTFFHGFRVNPTEAFYEAAAFAARGEPADAYGPGTGPTAHLPPGMPSMVGMVYHLWTPGFARAAKARLGGLGRGGRGFSGVVCRDFLPLGAPQRGGVRLEGLDAKQFRFQLCARLPRRSHQSIGPQQGLFGSPHRGLAVSPSRRPRQPEVGRKRTRVQ